MKSAQPRSAMKALIHEKLKRFGVSGPGRDWLLRALHPASEDPCPGLPDASATPVLRPDYRLQTTINPPASTGSSAWDCMIWTPPGDVNAVYWATGPPGVNFAQSAQPAGCEVGVLRLQPSELSSFTEPYTINYITSGAQALTSVPSIQTNSFRHMFKSITVHQIASAVSDQGQVYAAQFAPLLRNPCCIVCNGYDSGIEIPESDPPVNYQLVGALYTAVLPASEADLTAMAPDFYMGPSRDGIYMPLRLSGPSQPFARSTPSGPVYQANGGGGVFGVDPTQNPMGAICVPSANALASAGAPVPWVFRSMTVQSTGAPPQSLLGPLQFDTGYDNTNFGVIIFRGLQGSSGGGFGASLQLKCIAGLEIAPNPDASVRVFVQPAAPYEPRALEAYYALCLELRDAYPASYNSLESILDAIGGAASKVWDAVAPAVTKGASQLVDAGISHITRGFGGSLTGARRGRIPAMPQPSPSLVQYKGPPSARTRSASSHAAATSGRRVKIRARRR
jgi:hypothetical protein